jgi:hypothetical protein
MTIVSDYPSTIVSDYPSTILFDKFFHLFFDHLFQLAISPIIIPTAITQISFATNERVSEMLESTLETIMSSPFRASVSGETQEEDTFG